MEVFFFIGIVISFLLYVLVFSKKNKHQADAIFGVWQLVFLIHFTLLYIRFSDHGEVFSFLTGLDTPFVLVHIPLIFFYTSAVTGNSLPNSKKMLHLLPFGIVFLMSVLSFVVYEADDKLKLYNDQLGREYAILDILFVVQAIAYFPFLFKSLKRYSIKIKNQFSNVDDINLRWLQRIIMGAAMAFCINIILIFLVKRLDILSVEFIGKLTVLIVCGFQVYLGYYGLKYTAIFSEFSISISNDVKTKYDKTGINSTTTKEKFKELLFFMGKEKPYLNAELTLHQLADEFGVTYNHLSQIINENSQKNFYSFINQYRLNESIRLLQDEKNNKYTILAIAYESGFKSKSVFNTLFKKEKGITPSEFRKAL